MLLKKSKVRQVFEKLDKIYKGSDAGVMGWLNIKGKPENDDKTPWELIQAGHADKVLGFLIEFEKKNKIGKRRSGKRRRRKPR